MTAVLDLANDPFSQLLGQGRGRAQSDGILARRPTAEGRAELDELSADLVSKAGLSRALSLCGGHTGGPDIGNPDRRPLRDELSTRVVEAAGQYAFARTRDTVAEWMHLTGVQPKYSGQVVKSSSGKLHIFSDGLDYATTSTAVMLSGRPARLACGQKVTDTVGWVTQAHGTWLTSKEKSRCRRCMDQEYSLVSHLEELEMAPGDLMPGWAQEHFIREFGRTVTADARGAFDVDDLVDAHLPAMVLDIGVELARDRGERVFQWMLGAPGYEELRKRHGEMPLSSLLGRKGLHRWLEQVPLTARRDRSADEHELAKRALADCLAA